MVGNRPVVTISCLTSRPFLPLVCDCLQYDDEAYCQGSWRLGSSEYKATFLLYRKAFQVTRVRSEIWGLGVALFDMMLPAMPAVLNTNRLYMFYFQ